MSYRLKRSESLLAGGKRIAREQLGRAIREVQDEKLERHRRVHQVRKRCKKLRGLVRLLRPGLEADYEQENRAYRDAARTLSTLRDATGLIETFDMLRASVESLGRGDFEPLRRRLLDRRRRLAETKIDFDGKLYEVLGRLRVAKERIEDWTLEQEDAAVLEAGLAKTFGRGREAMRAAYGDPSTERFHEWRKRLKYHWYHLRLIEDVWPEVMGAHRKACKQLADVLGDEHDLAVFRETLLHDSHLAGETEEGRRLVGLVDRYRDRLRARALPLGERIFAEKAKPLSNRLAGYYQAWKAEADAETADQYVLVSA